MKNATPTTMTSLRYMLPLLFILLFVTLRDSQAQLATCNNDTSIANFGVNRMVYSNNPAGVDDWFQAASSTGSGQGVIGTTAQTAKPPMQISATSFQSLIQGATTVSGRNRTYVQGMAVPSLTVWNNMLLLDAFAARDNMSSSGATDSTVFAGGGDKNADNPNTWAIGAGGVQQKSDIIDVAGHIRRDLSTGDLWCFAMASILSPGGDNFIDFEYFRSTPVISGGTLTNTGLSTAGNHTPFLLNASGGIQSPGDVLAGLTYSLSNGSATLRIWIDPNNVDGAGHDTAWFNQLPNRFFTFTGGCIFGLNSGSYGYAEIRATTSSSCLVYSVVNNNTTPSGSWGTLSGSGAAYASTFVSEQMVEIAINFSDFGLDLNTLSGACFNVFGSLLVKTRSSSSVTSELKDFAGPFQFGNFTEVQADAGSDKIINCASSTVTLNGTSLTPGAVPSWTTPDGQILMGGNTFSPTVSQPGTYILTVASPSIATCVTTDTVVVTIDTLRPSANAGSDWTYDCNSAATRTLSGSSSNGGVNPVWTALNGGSIISDAATFNPVVSSTGCYVLTVTNPVNLCSNSDTVCAITQTDIPVITANQITQPSCNASCNASISLSVSGASGPYSFLWSDGQTGSSRTGLCAGSYQVTVTSANGCSSIFSAALVAPDELEASSGSGVVPVSCNGGANGSVTISATGGTAPYTGVGVFSGLSAGSYSYTVTDANGCSSTVSLSITEPTPVALSLVSNSPVLCTGESSGELVVDATGGITPYSYTWSNGMVGETLSTIPAGNYTVTITDANGCTQTGGYTVTEPATALSASSVLTMVGCYNGSTGAIDMTPAGGTAPYTYTWSTGAATQDVSNLAAGAYIVTVVDANGCQFSAVYNVDEPQAALAATDAVTDVACNGGASGQINLSVTGGTIPYSFLWSNGSIAQDLSGVSAGTYTVTVTDANGCLFNRVVSVGEPVSPLSSSATTVVVSCFGGSDGQIDLTPVGGTAPYQYLWNTNSTIQDLSNLQVGNYTVTITDANGCTYQQSVQVSQPTAPISATASTLDVSCFGGADGQIDLTIVGGTAPYIYQWSNGASTQDVLNISSGTYTVTVTDSKNCVFNQSFNVGQPTAALNATASTNAVGCFAGNDGQINLSPSGGTAPYSFLWSNGSTLEDQTGLAAGAYNVLITDANGCTFSQSVQVAQPPAPIAATAVTVNVGCNAAATGQIDLSVTGGTAPYSYLWSNGAATEDLVGLAAGIYTVVVTDANNCTFTQLVDINQPGASVSAVSATTDVDCRGFSTGQIDITATGGTSPYVYQWSNGSNSEDLAGVMAGIFTVLITDANNCTFTQSVTITEPAFDLTATTTVTAVDCHASSTGGIDLTPNGGTSPYIFQWNNGVVTEDQVGLVAGTYTVQITDANNCLFSISALVAQPPAPIAATAATVNVGCKAGATGQIDLNATGGTAPYTFLWSNGATTEDLFNLVAGIYTVVITDANNCTHTEVIDINQPGASVAALSTVTHVDCHGAATGQIDLTAIGGTTPYIFQWNNGATTEDQSGLMAGTYSVLITDANNCTFSQTITVTEPAFPLSAGTTVTDVDCYGSASGEIDLSTAGGTAPYIYQWNNGVITEDQIGITAGSYVVTVTDANNCVLNMTVVVDEPSAPLTSTQAIVDVGCNGDASGSIDITPAGGTSPYSYQWNNGLTTEDQSGLTAGVYDVLITDNNGCTFSATYTINEPSSALSSSNTVVNVDCNGNTSGQIDLSVSGGTSPYTFQWSNGTTTEDQPALSAGTYTVVITDANNCSSTTTISISEPSAAVGASSNVTAVGCNGDATGQIDLTASGGTAPYTYSWNNGVTTQDLANLSAGTYTVTITDVNGCTANHVVQVVQPQSAIQTNGTSIAADCIGGTLGTVTVAPTGGTAPFTYLWNNGFTSNQMANLNPGTYQVTVTDANGCTANATLVVDDNSTLTIQASGDTAICVGDSVTISGPVVSNATYQWLLNGTPLQGANTNSFITPVNGVYQLVVTTGCGPYTSNPVNITLRTVENVSITNNVIICTGESTQLQVNGGSTYSWSPSGSLDDATSASPVASPRQTTTYVVTITDDEGCSTTASVTVTVECDTLNVPNGFSPNGDGKNDTFVIDGLEQFPGTVLNIFNRWGNLVYKQKDYANDWNGTSNVGGTVGGNELPNGTYYYILDLNKGEKPLTGFVVIRR